MTWQGMRADITPVADIPNTAEEAYGLRLQKQGEMQRRNGFLSSSIAKQSGPIRYILSANRPSNNFITLGVAGSPQGFVVGGAGGGGLDPWPAPPAAPRNNRPQGEGAACDLLAAHFDTGTLNGSITTGFNFEVVGHPCAITLYVKIEPAVNERWELSGLGSNPADLTPVTLFKTGYGTKYYQFTAPTADFNIIDGGLGEFAYYGLEVIYPDWVFGDEWDITMTVSTSPIA